MNTDEVTYRIKWQAYKWKHFCVMNNWVSLYRIAYQFCIGLHVAHAIPFSYEFLYIQIHINGHLELAIEETV